RRCLRRGRARTRPRRALARGLRDLPPDLRHARLRALPRARGRASSRRAGPVARRVLPPRDRPPLRPGRHALLLTAERSSPSAPAAAMQAGTPAPRPHAAALDDLLATAHALADAARPISMGGFRRPQRIDVKAD